MADITQAGAPSKYTAGKVGDIYTDSITGKRYECVGVFHVSTYHGPETTYEWDEILTEGSGSGGSDGHTHSNKHVLDKLSQNSDGNLLFGGSEIQGSGSGEPGADGADGKSAYEIAVDHGFEGDEAAWLESLKGEPGADGKDGADGQPGKDGADGNPGADGKDGADGITPTIGANGNWFLGDTDTGVVAAGKDGADGQPGADGNPGADGKDGIDGADGVGISKIEKIGTVDLVDTYRITFTDNSTFEYTVTNGADGAAGEGGSGDVPDGVTYVNLSDSEDIGEITEPNDADRLGGRLPEYYAKAEDVSAITKYQKYVNTELGYGHCKLNGSYTPVVDELVPFVLIRGNIQMVDHKVVMRPGQTFQFNISMAFKNVDTNTWVNIAYRLKDLTNDVEIECAKPSGGNPQYENAYSTFTQYTNNTDSECEIGLIVKAIYVNDIMDEIYTSFTVQEINRAITIDPLNYVNENQGIEDAPVGHIISFMGNNAPDHYIPCDGTEYNISDYPYLAQHFIDQFGSVNHFGGDGSTTFAVPDLRGEFLRGTGTALRNTGTGGAVGEHQDGTEHLGLSYNANQKCIQLNLSDNGLDSTTIPTNVDTVESRTAWAQASNAATGTTTDTYGSFTSRPTNTAVLYCIKYEPTYFMVHKDYNTNYLQPTLYSEEERVVGCWINGKPLYEKTIQFTSGPNGSADVLIYDTAQDNLEELINAYGYVERILSNNMHATLPIPGSQGWTYLYNDTEIWVGLSSNAAGAYSMPGYLTIQYTKTADAEGSFTTQMIKDYAVAGYNNTVFPDYTNEIAKITTAGATYTATENCVVLAYVETTTTDGASAEIRVDGLVVAGIGVLGNISGEFNTFYMKAGQTLSTRATHGTYNLTIYGLQS